MSEFRYIPRRDPIKWPEPCQKFMPDRGCYYPGPGKEHLCVGQRIDLNEQEAKVAGRKCSCICHRLPDSGDWAE